MPPSRAASHNSAVTVTSPGSVLQRHSETESNCVSRLHSVDRFHQSEQHSTKSTLSKTDLASSDSSKSQQHIRYNGHVEGAMVNGCSGVSKVITSSSSPGDVEQRMTSPGSVLQQHSQTESSPSANCVSRLHSDRFQSTQHCPSFSSPNGRPQNVVAGGGKWANKRRDCLAINTTSADNVPGKSRGLSRPLVMQAVPVDSLMSNGSYDACDSSSELNGSTAGDNERVVPDQRTSSHVAVLPGRGVHSEPRDEGTTVTHRCRKCLD